MLLFIQKTLSTHLKQIRLAHRPPGLQLVKLNEQETIAEVRSVRDPTPHKILLLHNV